MKSARRALIKKVRVDAAIAVSYQSAKQKDTGEPIPPPLQTVLLIALRPPDSDGPFFFLIWFTHACPSTVTQNFLNNRFQLP